MTELSMGLFFTGWKSLNHNLDQSTENSSSCLIFEWVDGEPHFRFGFDEGPLKSI